MVYPPSKTIYNSVVKNLKLDAHGATLYVDKDREVFMHGLTGRRAFQRRTDKGITGQTFTRHKSPQVKPTAPAGLTSPHL